MKQSAETLREKKRVYRKRMKEWQDKTLEHLRKPKPMIWGKHLQNGTLIFMWNIKQPYAGTGRQYVICAKKSNLAPISPVCKLDNNGSIIKIYVDVLTNELNEIITGKELSTFIVMNEIHSN